MEIMEIWLQSIARAGGVIVPPGVSITPPRNRRSDNSAGTTHLLRAVAGLAGQGLYRAGRILERVGCWLVARHARARVAPCERTV